MSDPGPELVRIGIVSISDRASSGVYEDKGLPALQDWLTHALLAHQLHHRLRIREVIGLSAPALVVRLTAVAHMLASPLHAQPCDEFLRENLPKGFFTTRTP